MEQELSSVNALLRSAGRNPALSAVERRNRCAGIGLLLSLILYAFWVDPERVHVFRCLFRELTGWKCFACGLTHSLHASAHLDWAAAFNYHLFGPILFLSAGALLVYWVLELVLDRKGTLRIKPETIRIGVIVMGLAWLIYWLSRLSS